MVSSQRLRSPSSFFTSCSSSYDQQRANTAAHDKRTMCLNGFEPLSVDQDREVARRALADLKELYFDKDSDEESDDGEYESSSEIESRMSSRSHGNAGGLTLEELSVAVNAAIEYHCPPKCAVGQPPFKPRVKECDDASHVSNKTCPSSHCCRQLKEVATVSTGSDLKMFQDMLERKERQFNALRAEKIGSNGNVYAHESRESTAHPSRSVDQEQQTMACVRDQATETDLVDHHGSSTKGVTSARQLSSERTQSASDVMHAIKVGPTLADLANCHRKVERDRLASQILASESSWSSSCCSSPTDHALHSSFASDHSSVSSVRHRRHSGKMNNKINRAVAPSKSSRNSDHSSHKGQHQVRPKPVIETSPPNNWQSTQGRFDRVEGGSQTSDSLLPIDVVQVPRNPELVKWELDLSNFPC